MKRSLCVAVTALAAVFVLGGCASLSESRSATAARAAMNAEIQAEKPGNYYIGRRYYKVDYKFWGYIRKPGQPWTTAKLVMLNENKRLAPDRESRHEVGENIDDVFVAANMLIGAGIPAPPHFRLLVGEMQHHR